MTDSTDPAAGCRVLVVEDDGIVTMLLEELLADMGCVVAATASRFAQAMDHAAQGDYDVALLDVNLRGEYTFPVAEAVKARGKPFVLATGYNATILPDGLKGARLLRKPFRRADLAAALGQAIAGAG